MKGRKGCSEESWWDADQNSVAQGVLAMKRSKYSNDCMLHETKQKMSKEYQRELRKKLSEDSVKKEEFNRKQSEYMAHIRACEKWATNHNKRYGSMSDKVPAKISQKETTVSFGKVSRNYLFVFPLNDDPWPRHLLRM